MSVQSWPRVNQRQSDVGQTTRSEVGQNYVETMEDGDVVVPVLETHGEETVNERINNLYKTGI